MSRQERSESRRNAHNSYPIAPKPNPGNDGTRVMLDREGASTAFRLLLGDSKLFGRPAARELPLVHKRASRARFPCTQVGKPRTAIQKPDKSGDPPTKIGRFGICSDRFYN